MSEQISVPEKPRSALSRALERRSSISHDRRLVNDLCRMAQRIPLYPLERTFQLGELATLRQLAAPRISWSVLFMKAFGIVAASEPRLRQTFMHWPLAHHYEHPISVAMVAIERQDGPYERLFWGRFIEPESRSLLSLQSELNDYKALPVAEVFRRQRRFSQFPELLRRLGWWLTLNLSGAKRAKRVGTFGMSNVAGQGAVNRFHPSCLTCSLTWGPLDPKGRMQVTVVFDHRIIDGAPLARAMAEVERLLQGPISRELASLVNQDQAA